MYLRHDLMQETVISQYYSSIVSSLPLWETFPASVIIYHGSMQKAKIMESGYISIILEGAL